MNAAALPESPPAMSAPTEPIEPVRFDASDLDPNGDPRVDLDAFVNARWRARHPVPADRSCWDTFAVLAERTLSIEAAIAKDCASIAARPGAVERIVGDFWTSGMRAQPDDAPLVAELARIDRLDSARAIAAYIGDRHARGLGVVFRLDVDPDFDAPEQMIAYVSQAGLGLPDRDDYFDTSSRGIARRRAYLAHIAAMLALAGCNDVSLADDVLAFETTLAAASISRRVLARDIGQRYCPISTDAADRATPQFHWSTFFGELGIVPPARFSLAPPGFFAAMDEALRAVPVSVWRAYLRYHTVDEAAPYVGGAAASRHHAFHGETLARPAHSGAALEARAGYDRRARRRGDGRALRCACFRRRVQGAGRRDRRSAALGVAHAARLARLDGRSKRGSRASESLRRCVSRSPIRSAGATGRVFARRRARSTRTSLAARAFNQQERIAHIGRPVDAERWPMPPQTVNARYDPQRNEIVFPAALLAPPFFAPDADAALNFGGIGAVIAHEMIHAFDDQGSRFGADGRFENWWSAAKTGCASTRWRRE